MKNIEKIIEEKINAVNKTPLQDFDGFTPEDMYHIVYNPFDEKCPVQIRENLDNPVLQNCPIFNLAIELLLIIQEQDGIKLTPKGNIQQKVIKVLYEKRYIIDKFIDKGITSLRLEQNWIVLHNVKIVLKLSGILRQYKGKLLLTNRWKKVLGEQKYSEIFCHFLKTFTTEFNWAYNDGYEQEETGQVGFIFLLYLLNSYGQDFKDLLFYTEKYFMAFPTLAFKDGTDTDMLRYNDSQRALNIRFFERFAKWFGFVEIKKNDQKDYFEREIEIRKTEFFKSVFHFYK